MASNGQLRLAVDGALLHTPAVRAEVALSCVCCSLGKMVGRRMMFCVIIGHVCTTFVPVEKELALRRSASQPMKTHPYHFDPALDDGVGDECCGGRVVGLDWRLRLFPSHFF